jgi:hypothetical protein
VEASRPVAKPKPKPGAEPALPGEDGLLGRRGLRLAFLLSGLQEALADRLGQGEELTAQETSLLALALKDFENMRPQVIELAITRLVQVVAASVSHAGSGPGVMESFAIETLSSFARRAAQLLQDDTPEVALSLFGDAAGLVAPLAIFQFIFSAALTLVEAFAEMMPVPAPQLRRLADALGSEVERS